MADLNNPSKTGGKLIAASKVNGTSFYNGAGEKLLLVGEGVDGFLESLDADMDAPWVRRSSGALPIANSRKEGESGIRAVCVGFLRLNSRRTPPSRRAPGSRS